MQIVELWASQALLGKDAVCMVDGEEVPAVGPDLQPYGRIRARPERLRENEGFSFIGSYVLGKGFVLMPQQADDLITRDVRNGDVLQPYVMGRDLNQRPDCSASRWVINFWDWPLKRAEEYPECLEIVRCYVKPERDRNKRRARRERWWLYAERAPDLYRAIDGLDHVLVSAQVSSTLMPVRVPTEQVFNHKCVVFAVTDFANLALLSSNMHSAWVMRYTATMRTDISYSPSDAFLTWPRPRSTLEMAVLGEELDRERRELMFGRSWGLTTTYNHVHDPDCHDEFVMKLRNIHVAIDEAVMRAYGWDDLDLKIGHHPTKIGVRWTIGKEARFELLDRLLEENQRRYKLENP